MRPTSSQRTRPALPPRPVTDVGRELLGLAFLLDSGLRGGFIAEYWTVAGATNLSHRGNYHLSTTEGLLLRIALSIDTIAELGTPGDLRLLVNGLAGRALQAFIHLLQALGGGQAAQVKYCNEVFTAVGAAP